MPDAAGAKRLLELNGSAAPRLRAATRVCAARPRARLLGEFDEQIEPAADRDGQARLERPCSAAGQRRLERDRCLRICTRYLHIPDGAQTCTATRNPRTGVRGLRERGVCKEERRGHLWRDTCAQLRIARRYTRPYTPRTNGKAEAVIKTLLREWAYRFAYPTSRHRARALPGFVRWYNKRRPHGSLGGRPPISRVADLCGQYI